MLKNPSSPFKVHGHLQPRSAKHFYYKLTGTNMSWCQTPKLYFKQSFGEKAVTQLLKSNGFFSKSFMSDWDDCYSVFYLLFSKIKKSLVCRPFYMLTKKKYFRVLSWYWLSLCWHLALDFLMYLLEPFQGRKKEEIEEGAEREEIEKENLIYVIFLF